MNIILKKMEMFCNEIVQSTMSNKELEERSMIITMRVESILRTCRSVICSVSVLSELPLIHIVWICWGWRVV